MPSDTFLLALKSTIDKLGNDLAQAQVPPISFVDLDDSTATEAVFTSTNNALIWEMSSFDESPADPLYMATFHIGARTVNDPSNYSILALTGKVKEVFKVGSRIEIKDYSGLAASAKQGSLTIINVSVNPQAYDRTSGVRLISVTARARRWLS